MRTCLFFPRLRNTLELIWQKKKRWCYQEDIPNIPACPYQRILFWMFWACLSIGLPVSACRWYSRNDNVLSFCLSGGVCAEVRRPCRFLVLINPQSGKGQAQAMFNNHIQHMLQEADITYTLQITGEDMHRDACKYCKTQSYFYHDICFLVVANYLF